MRTLVWILPLVMLGTAVAGMADDPAQRLKRLFVADLLPQGLTQDQAPLPTDPTCQHGTLCTSWQVIAGSTMGPIEVHHPAMLFVSFDGNYNCDACRDAFGFPFVQVRIQLSTNGGPFVEVTETTLTRGNYVANSGVDVIRRRIIPVGKGKHKVRMQHRFTEDADENRFLTVIGLNEGTMRVEVLAEKSSPDTD